MHKHKRSRTAGFIGLGQMGFPMAENILRKGHSLVVYDVDARRVAQAVEIGAQAASGPADVARQASVVVSMVDTTAQAQEVIVGTGGLIDGAAAGDVIISMSTIDPMALRAMHTTLAHQGVGLIDAPVSGMEKGAREGALRAFVGGHSNDLDKARPVLEAMTAEIVHLGSIGHGTTMKLINNMLIQVGWVLTAEALALGTAAGLDPKQMVDLIGRSTGNSEAFQYSAPRILARDFEGIRMDITYKDVELQTQLAKALKLPMLMAATAQQVYQMGRAMGLGSEDGGAAIIKVYERMMGVAVVTAT